MPISWKWKVGSKTLYSADGEVKDSDIRELCNELLSDDNDVKDIYIDLSHTSSFTTLAMKDLYSKLPSLVKRGMNLRFINPSIVTMGLLRLFGAHYAVTIIKGI